MDIFRGRYRESFSDPKAIKPNTPLKYQFILPNANYTFQPGHRIMVQVQSSLFPLYDRNPQKYVPNIFLAKKADYQKATVTLERGGGAPSAVCKSLGTVVVVMASWLDVRSLDRVPGGKAPQAGDHRT